MSKRLEYSYPEKEGIDSRLIINFLNEAEKREPDASLLLEISG